MNASKNWYRLSIAGKLGLFWLILMFAVLGPSAHAVQSVTLAWDPSPDTNVAGYTLFYGQATGSSTNTIDVGRATTNTVSGLQETRTYFFFVKAYNSARIESAPSNLINYTVPGIPATNAPPTISSIADQTTSQNVATTPIAFTVGDAETPAGNLTVSGASSNPNLVPVSNIVFGGSGAIRTLIVTPSLNQSGTATITVTVNDGSASTSETFVLTVNPPGSFTPVFLSFEAESGTLLSPMAIGADQNASGGRYIATTTFDSGRATFAVDIPAAGDYVIWCRVLSPDGSFDSYYVSVDAGAEAIYATAENKWTNSWQWTAVNDIANALDPRTFQLGAGRHNIVFRGREEGTALDQILITNDRNFVPDVVFTATTPNVSISSIVRNPAGSVTLTWPTVPGKSYRVVYKTNLSNPAWTALNPDVVSTSTTASRSDYLVGNRFYGVVQLP